MKKDYIQILIPSLLLFSTYVSIKELRFRFFSSLRSETKTFFHCCVLNHYKFFQLFLNLSFTIAYYHSIWPFEEHCLYFWIFSPTDYNTLKYTFHLWNTGQISRVPSLLNSFRHRDRPNFSGQNSSLSLHQVLFKVQILSITTFFVVVLNSFKDQRSLPGWHKHEFLYKLCYQFSLTQT